MSHGTKVKVSLPRQVAIDGTFSEIQLLVQTFDIYLNRLTLLPSNLLIHFNVEVDGFSFTKSYSNATSHTNHTLLTEEAIDNTQSLFQSKLNEMIRLSISPLSSPLSTISDYISFTNALVISRKLQPVECSYLAFQNLEDNDPLSNHDISVSITGFVVECKQHMQTTADFNESDHVPIPGCINNGKDYVIGLSLIRYLNGMPLLDHDDDAAACVQSMSLRAVNWLNYGVKLFHNQSIPRKMALATPEENMNSGTDNNTNITNERNVRNSYNNLPCYLRSSTWSLQSLYPTDALKEGSSLYHVVLLIDVKHNNGKSVS